MASEVPTLPDDLFDFYVEMDFIDQSLSHHYQSIAASTFYRHLSHEEIRLHDYLVGASASADAPFGVVAPAKRVWCGATSTPSLRRVHHSATPYAHGTHPAIQAPANERLSVNHPFVLVTVGNEPDMSTFVLQQDVVMRQSGFFNAALKDEWNEGAVDDVVTIVDMDDDDPGAFSIYAEWLWSGAIYTMADKNHAKRDDDTEYQQLVQAYILGDKLRDKDFQNTIIDAMIEKLVTSNFVDLKLANIIYESTLPASPLRRLLVDMYVWAGNPSWITREEVKPYLHSDFMFDLNCAHFKANATGTSANGAPYLRSPCDYHDHEDGGGTRRCVLRAQGQLFNPRVDNLLIKKEG